MHTYIRALAVGYSSGRHHLPLCAHLHSAESANIQPGWIGLRQPLKSSFKSQKELLQDLKGLFDVSKTTLYSLEKVLL